MNLLNPHNCPQRKVRECFGSYDIPKEAWPLVEELARATNPAWKFNQEHVMPARIFQEYGEPNFQYMGYRGPIVTLLSEPKKELIAAVDGRLAYARLELTLDNNFGDLLDLSNLFKEIREEVRKRNAVFGFSGHSVYGSRVSVRSEFPRKAHERIADLFQMVDLRVQDYIQAQAPNHKCQDK